MPNTVVSGVLGVQAGAADAFSSPPPVTNKDAGDVINQVTGDDPVTSVENAAAIDGMDFNDLGAPTYFGVPLDQIMDVSAAAEDDGGLPDPGQEYVPTPEETGKQAPPAQKHVPSQSEKNAQQALENYSGDDPRLLKMQAELQQYKSMVPIMEHINSDPRLAAEIFDVIDKNARAQSSTKEPPVPEAPTPPERPSDFSPELAYTDPTSTSWKYRESMEKFDRDTLQYKLELSERKLQKVEADRERERQAREQAAHIETFRRQALARGANAEQAEKFAEFMSRPNVSDDQIWQLFQLSQGGAFETPAKNGNVKPTETKTVKDPVKEKAQRLNYPTPSTTSAAVAPSGKSQADLIFDGLVAYTNANDAF